MPPPPDQAMTIPPDPSETVVGGLAFEKALTLLGIPHTNVPDASSLRARTPPPPRNQTMIAPPALSEMRDGRVSPFVPEAVTALASAPH